VAGVAPMVVALVAVGITTVGSKTVVPRAVRLAIVGRRYYHYRARRIIVRPNGRVISTGGRVVAVVRSHSYRSGATT
jgi:hypothetical protein